MTPNVNNRIETMLLQGMVLDLTVGAVLGCLATIIAYSWKFL